MTNAGQQAPVAVVTGGNRGIGRSICRRLAQAGWDVALSYRSHADEAQEVVRDVQAHGQRAMAVQADVGSHAHVRALFEAIDAGLGAPRALVNNAGIIGQACPVIEADAANLEAVLRANVLGTFFCIREAARRMSRQHGGVGGVIVNMSSAAARHGGLPNEAHYAASKGAIDSLTLALARELAPHGIRVNAVRPGLIGTAIHAVHGGDDAVRRLGATVPLGRAGTPEEVAEVVGFLCGEASSYVHGALLDVGGGR